MTAILNKYGWDNISSQKNYKNKYMKVEWWHFQCTEGLNRGDTFNSELLKVYTQEYIDETYAGNKKYLDYIYSGGGAFIENKD